MINQLPYPLTKGVVATREGLTGDVEHIGRLLDVTPDREADPPVVPWPDAAERLLITDEVTRWAVIDDEVIVCASGRVIPRVAEKQHALHRLAAILCDDAEAFRVLHWCVTEFGGQA